jgi:hypothetical protein
VTATPPTQPAPLTPAAAVDQGGETVVRRFVTVLAVLVGGLCFLFSAGNVYQLAVDLNLWAWIRPLVAPAVDLSLVALVVGIRFLARRGVSGRELRRPRLFLLAVGLAAWALNVAGAVADRDWGKAAFDSLAPGLLLGWAEVLPWFLRQFHAVTHPTAPVPPSLAAAPPPGGNGAPSPTPAPGPGVPVAVTAVPAATAAAGGGNGTHPAGTGGPYRATSTGAGTSGTARPVPATTPGGSGERDADAVMRAWWAAQRAAGRTPSGAELDRACGRDPRNGSGRKARARYLREEAAGRFRAPQPVPAPAAPAAAPGPDGATAASGTPAQSPSPTLEPTAAAAEREPARPAPGGHNRPPHPQPLPRPVTAPARRDAR